MRIGTITTLVTLAALACQQDRQSQTGLASLVRDSAGIHVAENARPPEGSRLAWRIGPEPTVSIGQLEGEEPYLLHWAGSFARLPDGRIMVANRGSSEVRVFDASGSHLVSWGGQGEGPGEFMSLSHVAQWPGDSVVAWYSPGLGISVFDSRGNYGRSFGLQSGEEAPGRRPRPIVARTDGTILSIKDPEDADTAVVEIWDADGALSASLGTHPSTPVIVTTNERGYKELKPIAYGRRLVRGLWGDLIVVSPTDRYEIRAFRADGTLARIVRRDHDLRAPTQADLEPYIEEQVGMVSSSPELPEGFADEMRKSLAETPLAKTFPAFSTILSDAAGNLWVREYDFPREERPAPLWTVFDPEGRVLGFVETPKGLRVGQIGEDYILGHYRDELDIEYVQVWPLERSEG